jgi:HSP20 family protein
MSTKTQEKQMSTTGETQEPRSLKAITPFEEMDRLFDSFLSRNWLSPFNYSWPRKQLFQSSIDAKIPTVDVIDRDNEIVVRSEIPGVDKKDLEVTMTDNTVTIKGNTRKEEKEEKGDYYYHEISSGAFSRTVSLPCDVNSSETKSTFKDGVLELTVPKSKAVKRHTIKF